jgi:phenylacetate-CoA ligase
VVELGVHDWMSREIFPRISRWQRLLRPSTGPVTTSFGVGLRFRRANFNWSEEEKRSWILDKLRANLRHAQTNTIFYAKLFRNVGFDPNADFTFEDYARLPILSREQIKNNARELLANSVDRSQVRKDATGGSTGVPTEVWLGPEERGWSESGMEFFFEQLGVPSGVRTALFWGHNLDPKASSSLRDRCSAFIQNVRWFDCLRLSPEALDEVHEELQRFRPARVIAYASALAHLAERVLERDYRPVYPTKCFITGAEKLWPHQREVIQKAFGRPVHERYGGRDVACIGVQLDPAHTTDFTVDWANVLIEPESSASESTLLVTKLHADAMPMLRYRVGDVARFPAGSGPGIPTFKLHEVLGRVTDRIWLPNGSWVSGLQVPHLLKDFPVREFLFLQRPDYSIELQIVPQKGFDAASASVIRQSVTANLPNLSVKILLTDAIVRTKANKWRPVISEVEIKEE